MWTFVSTACEPHQIRANWLILFDRNKHQGDIQEAADNIAELNVIVMTVLSISHLKPPPPPPSSRNIVLNILGSD